MPFTASTLQIGGYHSYQHCKKLKSHSQSQTALFLPFMASLRSATRDIQGCEYQIFKFFDLTGQGNRIYAVQLQGGCSNQPTNRRSFPFGSCHVCLYDRDYIKIYSRINLIDRLGQRLNLFWN